MPGRPIDWIDAPCLVFDTGGQLVDANGCARQLFHLDDHWPEERNRETLPAEIRELVTSKEYRSAINGTPAVSIRFIGSIPAWYEFSFYPARTGAIALGRTVAAPQQDAAGHNPDLLQAIVDKSTLENDTLRQELESFTYSVSHDLRAPLRHIGGFAKLLSEEAGEHLSPTEQHYLDRINEGIQKMAELIDGLLTLGRVGRHDLRVQSTDLNSIVRAVIDDLSDENGPAKPTWNVSRLSPAICDPLLMRQVLFNLLANAVKFTSKKKDPVIEVLEQRDFGKREIIVRDNGAGFSMNHVDRLFGLFQRLHRQEEFPGTGVGLAIVSRIMQKHGGSIRAEAEPENGAAFYLSLGKADNAQFDKESGSVK